MEKLRVDSIPQLLLARILLQLLVIPQQLIKQDGFDLIAILAAGLQEYGSTPDLDGMLQSCRQAATSMSSQANSMAWQWESRRLARPSDWVGLDGDPNRVALHIYLASDETRQHTELSIDRNDHASKESHDTIPPESILNGTLYYLQTNTPTTSEQASRCDALTSLIKQRLNHLELQHQCQEAPVPSVHWALMGALMVRNLAVHTGIVSDDTWCLYLRDYMEDAAGSSWRILRGKESEQRVSSDQALADIRGLPCQNISLSPLAAHYQPFCLFYCNDTFMRDTIQQNSAQDPNSVVTIEDYALDDEEEDLNEICKHCGIPESVDNINTIFFCDECNLGVHQLCETPPVAAFELDLDPWYCRDCLAAKGLPVPTEQNTKRKREDEGVMDIRR